MPQTLHSERHFEAGAAVRDVVIGMADGLTVPFALVAGLSGAVDSAAIIITAGLAEIAAGSIAMGLGGYLAAKSDADHYASERRRERIEIGEKPDAELAEVIEVFEAYGLTTAEAAPVARALAKRPDVWVDFMMRFELGLEAPSPRRAMRSALTIGGAYAAGGFVPLAPYMFASGVRTAQLISIVVTIIALLTFGYVKAQFTGAAPIRGALQTTLVGGLAAAAAYLIARAIT
jgi:VIT1/CCC1 family predicted Fe2+/Mn2+ transporter